MSAAARASDTGRHRGWLGLLLGACLAGAGCRQEVDVEQARRFTAAGEAMTRATTPPEFEEIAARYLSLVREGIDSGALLFNLGNAWQRAGHRGRAVVAYRMAQRYRPADPYLAANLRQALAGSEHGLRDRRWYEHVLFWQDSLAYADKLRLLVLLAGLGVFADLVGRARSSWVWRRAAVVTMVLALLLGASALLDHQRIAGDSFGAVDREVVARKGNAETFEPAFTEPLTPGTEFQLVERRGPWLRVRVGRDLDGWIPAETAFLPEQVRG